MKRQPERQLILASLQNGSLLSSLCSQTAAARRRGGGETQDSAAAGRKSIIRHERGRTDGRTGVHRE